MKPIIGLNLDIKAGQPARAYIKMDYLDAVVKAGGIPVLLPPLNDEDLNALLTNIQGLILIGGPDYCPSLYGEAAHDSVELIDERRQDFDLRLMKRALSEPGLPLLGICGGLQLLNITLGGSLIQDIQSELPESQVVHTQGNDCNNGCNKHQVAIEADSRLGKIYGHTKLAVPTSHHQAVRKLGRGLKAVAYADDGVVEAIELPEHQFAIGVQWHPERDYAGNSNLFQEFVKQSAQRGK